MLPVTDSPITSNPLHTAHHRCWLTRKGSGALPCIESAGAVALALAVAFALAVAGEG